MFPTGLSTPEPHPSENMTFVRRRILILLASALSDASLELPGKYSLQSIAGMQIDDNGPPQYHYGWCLQLSGLALMLAEVAAVLTMSGYMARFSTVEKMVRVMVLGAERKLKEKRGLTS
ncbi:uncharacterized protein [Linepithema humile]|uniref:uncharacterized protein n=1 Tax=Linepithema humile TaxID=83485 RepID=UPI00351E6984